MHDALDSLLEEEWVIWNGSHGLVTTATLGRLENGTSGRVAWLDEPFDMVGPFNLDELERNGRIAFAACIVMSRQRWQADQVALRRESYQHRRAEAERLNAEYGHNTGGGFQNARKPFDEQPHRQTLKLPREGKLEPSQIRAAFRRLAQKVHPDMGGSHEEFVRIKTARDELLAYSS